MIGSVCNSTDVVASFTYDGLTRQVYPGTAEPYLVEELVDDLTEGVTFVPMLTSYVPVPPEEV